MAIAYPILSKYRLIARLARGGMAEVFLALIAERPGFNKLQVLKVSRPDIMEQVPEWLQMFEAEARLAARLNHPNIVQTQAVGAEDGHHFIVMEYLEGQSLSRVQKRAWAAAPGSVAPGFPLEMHLFVLCEVLAALDYAHGLTHYDGTPLRIVHRDVSPQNVVITYAGQTKLVDFGIAKTFDSNKTRAGVIKGKLSYIAPEQIPNDDVDHRADLYSVGVMLWTAIARRDMYGKVSPVDIERRLLLGDVPKIREAVPAVPEQLEAIVNRALAPKPADRYPSARALRDDLVTYLDGLPKVTAREVGERVARLFAPERGELDAIVCQAVADTQPSADGRAPAREDLPEIGGSTPPPPRSAPSSLRQSTPSSVPVSVELESVTRRGHDGPASTSVPPVQVSPKRSSSVTTGSSRWLPVVFGVIVVTAALVLALQTLRDHEQAAVPALPAAERADSSVRLDIWTIPSGAELRLDGQLLGTSPHSSEHPREAAEHTLEISLPGHVAQRLALRFQKDADLEFRLTPDAPSRAPIERAPRPRRGRPRADSPSISRAVSRAVDLQASASERTTPSPSDEMPVAPRLDIGDPWAPEPEPALEPEP